MKIIIDPHTIKRAAERGASEAEINGNPHNGYSLCILWKMGGWMRHPFAPDFLYFASRLSLI